MLLDADQQRHEEVGEDTWELFETIERSFEVELGDYYALVGIRVSQLAEKISALANYPTREKCLSAVAFYRLRRALHEICGVPARSIRPSTLISDVLPWSKRRQQWILLEEATGLSFPGLTFPGWLLLVCLALPLTLFVSAKTLSALPMGWMSIFGASAALILPGIFLCMSLARAFPSNCATVGDLAKALSARNFAQFAMSNVGSSYTDLQETLILLIAMETGLNRNEVLPSTRIPSGISIY
jgi:hypothetical protein